MAQDDVLYIVGGQSIEVLEQHAGTDTVAMLLFQGQQGLQVVRVERVIRIQMREITFLSSDNEEEAEKTYVWLQRQSPVRRVYWMVIQFTTDAEPPVQPGARYRGVGIVTEDGYSLARLVPST